MRKMLTMLLMVSVIIQGLAQTIVKGNYDSKKKRYTELSQKFEKEILLNYKLVGNKKDIVVYKTEDYDISVRKSDLLELYNENRKEKITDIKNIISYKEKKTPYIYNDVAKLVENNKAVIYDRKNKKEINHIIKVKYNNNIYYDAGRGSNYNGYYFYADKTLTERIMRFDVITRFGIALHGSLGDNPYNRELSEKEKESYKKYGEEFEKRKELYKKSISNPNVDQFFSY